MEQESKITTLTKGNVGIIGLVGDVTGQAEEPITRCFQKFEKEGLTKVLLKFNEATYINSSGLGIIISLVAAGKKKNQRVAACGLSKHFQKVFDMIGLTEYIEIYATEEDAMMKL